MGQKTTASWKVDGPSHEEISAFAETVQAGYSKSIPHLGRRKVPEMWVCLSENDRKKTTQNRWFIIFYPYSTHSHDERGRFSSIFRHTGPFLGDKNAQEMLEPNHAKRNSYKAEPPTYIYIRYFDTWNRVSIHLVLHIEQQDPHIGSISYNFGWFWFCGFVLGHHLKTL